MTLDQLDLFRQWLEQPHVARWFLQDSTIEAELADREAAIRGVEPTHAVIVWLDQEPVGWAQWYRWDDYPATAADYGADPGEIGIDYCIGDPDRIDRGWGTKLIGAVIDHIETLLGATSMMTAPSAANRASCRILEKNGFTFSKLVTVADEPNASPLAVYRRTRNPDAGLR